MLVVGALLSAFMNNIAALVVTMPIATGIARDAGRPPSAVLMPLAFATILGGMTTLIGTPANLILSSAREEALGEGFGFFAMTPVGGAVALAGLVYLTTIGRRLIPKRDSAETARRRPWRVFELVATASAATADIRPVLRAAGARALAHLRGDLRLGDDEPIAVGDRLLVLSRAAARDVAAAPALAPADPGDGVADEVTARVSVAHGSMLIGLSYEELRIRSGGLLRVVAAGPRAARLRRPLASLTIAAGD